MHASAPGKLVLCGEYAVLEGAPALVLAVDVRAGVTIEDTADGEFRVAAPDVGVTNARFVLERGHVRWGDLDETRVERLGLVARLIETFGVGQPPFRLRVDTRAFSLGGEKLGLGSSAAVTVALAAALCSRALREPPRVEDLVALHREWQDGRGSGLDVAASLQGGLLVYRLEHGGPAIEKAGWPDALHWCCAWSGRAAGTVVRLRGLSDWRARAPSRYREAMRELQLGAQAAADAMRRADVRDFLAIVADYAQRLRRFGEQAGLDIFSHAHAELAGLADECGTVYKPCGAGGGDVGIALSDDVQKIDAFRRRAAHAGFRVLELEFAGHGLDVCQAGIGASGAVANPRHQSGETHAGIAC